MKAVLISIQPKWVELIASGKKTIEVRKTKPNLQKPFKVYIYCTKAKNQYLQSKDNLFFYCENKDFIGKHGAGLYRRLNSKVIGEFVCKGIMQPFDSLRLMAKESCLTENELLDYSKGKTLYGWRIADLKIYDKPKELSEFFTTGHCFNHANTEIVENMMGDYVEQCWKNSFCRMCRHLDDFGGCGKRGKQLTRPPQSWCYVEGCKNEGD
jgi:predicted transcriptional regulator